MINIEEVKTKKQQKEFIEFPLKLYKDNPYFVPPLYSDEKKLFRSDYVYYETCDAVYYNAYRDNVMVGRISGILQKASNEIRNQKRVRFTRFDSIDDQEVANALFNAVEKWAYSLGMDTVVGPLGFSDFEREGLLIEGFDELSTFEEQYNFPYYQKLIENCGYEKEVDWVESKVYPPDEPNENLDKLADFVMKRYDLHFYEAKNIKEFAKIYFDDFFNLVDECYSDIYMTVPFTEPVKEMIRSDFIKIVDLKYVTILFDKNERPVCFAIDFPSLSKVVQKSGGRLTIPTIIKLLKAKKHPNVIDFGLIGVIPEYRQKGIHVVILSRLIKFMKDNNIEYAETNLNLEDNYAIRNQWKYFKAHEHKRRRSFIKSI